MELILGSFPLLCCAIQSMDLVLDTGCFMHLSNQHLLAVGYVPAIYRHQNQTERAPSFYINPFRVDPGGKTQRECPWNHRKICTSVPGPGLSTFSA